MGFNADEGAVFAILLVIGIVLCIAWAWVVWVAVGEILAWLVIKDTLVLHVFLWVLGNAACVKVST